MESKLRDAVWKRDKGVCQECNRSLLGVPPPTDPKISISRELSALREIHIYRWSRKCWICEELTPVVSYDFQAGFNYSISDVEKLDLVLLEKYPFVKRVFSKIIGREVIANTCVHCGKLQGNFFISEDLLEMKYEVDMNTLVDISLPNTLEVQDLYHERLSEPQVQPTPVRLSIGHIHHKDLNWENNNLNNLVLLCENCHNRLHSQIGKTTRSQRSRSTVRKEVRIRRERRETDKWRQNYQKLKESKKKKNL